MLNFGIWQPIGSVFLLFMACLAVAVRLLFAVSVYLDAQYIDERDGRLMFVGAGGWAVAVFVAGLFGVLVYWALHHSALRPSVARELHAADAARLDRRAEARLGEVPLGGDRSGPIPPGRRQ
jgi:hypothetical protein